MVTVPRSSIDQVKIITEHDILKFVGTIATALLVPIVLWTFVSTNSKLNDLSEGVHHLNIQVAVLEEKLKRQHDYTSLEIEETKRQLHTINSLIQSVKVDAGKLVEVTNSKAAKGK